MAGSVRAKANQARMRGAPRARLVLPVRSSIFVFITFCVLSVCGECRASYPWRLKPQRPRRGPPRGAFSPKGPPQRLSSPGFTVQTSRPGSRRRLAVIPVSEPVKRTGFGFLSKISEKIADRFGGSWAAVRSRCRSFAAMKSGGRFSLAPRNRSGVLLISRNPNSFTVRKTSAHQADPGPRPAPPPATTQVPAQSAGSSAAVDESQRHRQPERL